jgi:hypothetical protein
MVVSLDSQSKCVEWSTTEDGAHDSRGTLVRCRLGVRMAISILQVAIL